MKASASPEESGGPGPSEDGGGAGVFTFCGLGAADELVLCCRAGAPAGLWSPPLPPEPSLVSWQCGERGRGRERGERGARERNERRERERRERGERERREREPLGYVFVCVPSASLRAAARPPPPRRYPSPGVVLHAKRPETLPDCQLDALAVYWHVCLSPIKQPEHAARQSGRPAAPEVLTRLG